MPTPAGSTVGTTTGAGSASAAAAPVTAPPDSVPDAAPPDAAPPDAVAPVVRAGPPRPARRRPGPTVTVLCALVVAAVVGWLQNLWAAALPIPATAQELLVGSNAYGLTDLGAQLVDADRAERVLAFHIAVYGVLSGATGRAGPVAGSVREFAVLAVVAGALALFLVCRQFALHRLTAVGVVLVAYGAAAVATTQTLAPTATTALTWVVVAGALIGARSASPGLDRLAAAVGLGLLALAAVLAPVVLVPAAGVLAVSLATGVLLPRLPRVWRTALGLVAVAALVLVALPLLVDTGAVPTLAGTAAEPALTPALPIVVGTVLTLVALAAAWRVLFVRPLALGVLPLVPFVLVPAAAQPAAVVLAVAVTALLLGALVEELATRPWRRASAPSIAARIVAATLTLGTVVGLALLPPVAAAGSDDAATASVAAWLQTYLLPERRVLVDDQLFVELIRAGVPATRFEREGRGPRAGAEPATFLATRGETDLPVLARFGSGPFAVDLALLVDDPAGYPAAEQDSIAVAAAFAEALVANPNIGTDDDVAALLLTGRVDPRMLTVLATAAADYRFTLTSLSEDVGAEPGGGIRTAEITDIIRLTDSGPRADGADVALRDFFRYQLAQFRPLTLAFDDGRLRVVYDAPAPLDLLS